MSARAWQQRRIGKRYKQLDRRLRKLATCGSTLAAMDAYLRCERRGHGLHGHRAGDFTWDGWFESSRIRVYREPGP